MSNKLSKVDISQISTYQSGVAQAAAHRVLKRINADFLLTYGLSPMQWYAIGLVYDAGAQGMRTSDLARQLNTTVPYITNTIAVLESRGMIEKRGHKGDSRIKLLVVPSSFHQTVEEIEVGLRDHLRDVLYNEDHITRQELTAYIHVLYKLIGN